MRVVDGRGNRVGEVKRVIVRSERSVAPPNAGSLPLCVKVDGRGPRAISSRCAYSALMSLSARHCAALFLTIASTFSVASETLRRATRLVEAKTATAAPAS